VAGVALAWGTDDPSTVDMDDFGYVELTELRALLLTVEVGGNKLTPKSTSNWRHSHKS
jgi:hypothetical protein